MKNYNIEVGNRIQSIRKKRKMSMKELGIKVNLHESTISRYEKGNIKALDIEKLKEFADALGVSSQFLTGWDAQPSKKHLDKIDRLHLTDAELDEVVNYAIYLKSKRK